MKSLLIFLVPVILCGCCTTGDATTQEVEANTQVQSTILDQSATSRAVATNAIPDFLFAPTETEVANTSRLKAADPSAIQRCITEHLSYRTKYNLGQLSNAAITAPCYSALKVQPPQIKVCGPGEC